MAASKSFLDSLKKPEPTSFKMTDFRRELHLRHKRDEHAKKERMKALQESKLISKYAITIDTSRARSNCDVLRMSIKELGFKEVITYKYIHVYYKIIKNQINSFKNTKNCIYLT